MTHPILQPGTGTLRGDHYLPCDPDRVSWGWLPDRTTAPALAIRSGESVTVDTVSHEGILEDQGRDPLRYLAQHGVRPDAVLEDAVAIAASAIANGPDDGPHVVTGPVHVAGAEPGDLLRVDVLALERRVPYGFISSRHGYGSLVGEFPEADGWRHGDDAITLPGTVSHFCRVGDADGLRDPASPARAELDAGGGRTLPFDLAPFLGLMGVAVDTDRPVPSVPPGRHGGNIDVKHAVVGSTLYLPVQVAGAGFYTGDPHFAQGNGEVALTALEASLRATLRFTVLRAGLRTEAVGAVDVPMLETPTHWIPTGMDPDLDVAVQEAVRNAILFLHTRFDVPRSIAMAYLSAAGDFEVSQVVDAVKGVHCMIRKADFAAWM